MQPDEIGGITVLKAYRLCFALPPLEVVEMRLLDIHSRSNHVHSVGRRTRSLPAHCKTVVAHVVNFNVFPSSYLFEERQGQGKGPGGNGRVGARQHHGSWKRVHLWIW